MSDGLLSSSFSAIMKFAIGVWLTEFHIFCFPANTEMRFGDLVSTSNLVQGEKITVQSSSDLLWTISIKKVWLQALFN
jgi:hypothetical protein